MACSSSTASSSSSSSSTPRSIFSRSSSTDSLSTISSDDIPASQECGVSRWKGGLLCVVDTPISEDGIDINVLGKRVVGVLQHGSTPLLYRDRMATHSAMTEGIASVRSIMKSRGYTSTPLMISTGHGSSSETTSFLQDAFASGATHAIVPFPDLPVCHLRANRFVMVNYLRRILDASPIPIMLDTSTSKSQLGMDELGRLVDHPMCFGLHIPSPPVELLRSLTAKTTSKECLLERSAHDGDPFIISHSQPDRLLPLLMMGATSCMIPTNLLEKASELYHLSRRGVDGDMSALLEAGILQAKIASDHVHEKA